MVSQILYTPLEYFLCPSLFHDIVSLFSYFFLVSHSLLSVLLFCTVVHRLLFWLSSHLFYIFTLHPICLFNQGPWFCLFLPLHLSPSVLLLFSSLYIHIPSPFLIFFLALLYFPSCTTALPIPDILPLCLYIYLYILYYPSAYIYTYIYIYLYLSFVCVLVHKTYLTHFSSSTKEDQKETLLFTHLSIFMT